MHQFHATIVLMLLLTTSKQNSGFLLHYPKGDSLTRDAKKSLEPARSQMKMSVLIDRKSKNDFNKKNTDIEGFCSPPRRESTHVIFDATKHNYSSQDNNRRTFLSRFLWGAFSIHPVTIFPTRAFGEDEPIECKNGAIISESAVPGAYQQSCMNLPERSFSLKSTRDTITVYQGANSGGGMAGRTGVAVWNSGILLTRLLDSLSAESQLLKGKIVLELGCGAALASCASAKLGAESVIATDANPEVLQLAQRNIERNEISTIAKSVQLQWGLMDAAEYDSTADVIIGSDLTYNSGSWLALAETMSIILKPGGFVIYLTLGHSGFNVSGELGGFLSTVESKGLQLLGKESNELTSRLQTLLSPSEKSVIDANGGARVILLSKKKFK